MAGRAPELSSAGHELSAIIRELRAIAFDFDGVFTDNTILVDQNGVESVRCWRSDGLGLARLRELGLKMVIVSTEVNPVVTARANKLKMECLQGIPDKARTIAEWSASVGVDLSRTAFVGNDINDIGAFNAVGLPIGVADSYDEIEPYIRYRTRTPGGYGAVREICDLIVSVRSDAASVDDG